MMDVLPLVRRFSVLNRQIFAQHTRSGSDGGTIRIIRTDSARPLADINSGFSLVTKESRYNKHSSPVRYRSSRRSFDPMLALRNTCLMILLVASQSLLDVAFGGEVEEFFERRVRPLLVDRCYECHSSETAAENGELALDSSTGLKKGGTRGPLVVPGKPDASLLIQAVRYQHDDVQMPPSGKLPAAEINILTQWVRLGGTVPKYGEARARRAERIDLQSARQFWSVRPLTGAALPTPSARDVGAETRDWNRGPLDAFVQERLLEAAIHPSEPAKRRTLLRRLSFDLVGLPPSPDEVQAFVTDARPDSLARVTDRLLASPHYGERWARMWLDLARYTDTTATWLKSTGQAWLYRDWVIDALNQDVPYDQFVRLQLAADMLPQADPKDQAALGFLGLSPTYWKELRLSPGVIKTVVAEEWDERIDAVTRTFLGLTASCARCHDHKFDPVTMDDYYALAGVFASTQLADRPLLPTAAADAVVAARTKIKNLEAKLEGSNENEAAKVKQKISSIREKAPSYDGHWVHAVEESSVFVLPDGPNATRLEYRRGQPRDLPLFRRGSPTNTGAIVPRGFLQVFSSGDRLRFQSGSGRLELANAILDDAGALTARVLVNRLWQQHFIQGLVRTASNFGVQGEAPSHPKLLDWLAHELVRQDWAIKPVQREIVLSATYRQSSQFNAEAQKIDPENRLLWRMNRRRLSVEMWRDAMLTVAGQSAAVMGGPAIALKEVGNRRRTIYGIVARRELEPMLRIFDFPEPTSHSPRRLPTTTPLQQLFVLNGPFIQQQAQSLAGQLSEQSSDRERIELCYYLLFSRSPSDTEIALGQKFVQDAESFATSPEDRWMAYAHSLLGLNEFLFVD